MWLSGGGNMTPGRVVRPAVPLAYVTGGDILYLLIGLGAGCVVVFSVFIRLRASQTARAPKRAARSADMRMVAAMVVAAEAVPFVVLSRDDMPWYVVSAAGLLAYGFYVERLKTKARSRRPPE